MEATLETFSIASQEKNKSVAYSSGGWTPASHVGDSSWIPGKSMWDLCLPSVSSPFPRGLLRHQYSTHLSQLTRLFRFRLLFRKYQLRISAAGNLPCMIFFSRFSSVFSYISVWNIKLGDDFLHISSNSVFTTKLFRFIFWHQVKSSASLSNLRIWIQYCYLKNVSQQMFEHLNRCFDCRPATTQHDIRS